MRAFQHGRGLHADGVCDAGTWLALVEASWRLGDRPLKLMAPQLRGDDVSRLQSQLGRLGFDCGRVDGIFGNATARALEDFQRNCGLEADGVFGPLSARALDVNSRNTGDGPGVATVREFEQLSRSSSSLHDLRIVVGQFCGLSALIRSVAAELRRHGANVIAVDDFEPTLQAAAANRHAAAVYLGFEAHAVPIARVAYYSTDGFYSSGGKSLACNLRSQLVAAGAATEPDWADVVLAGMRLPVLRETRMPAVVCSFGPVQRVVDSSTVLTRYLVEAIRSWAAAPAVAVAT